MAVTIVVLAAIGLLLGILIYLVNIVIPHRVKGLEKTEEIAAILPGANCGACGNPGCFAYAQALAKDPDQIVKNPCTMVLGDDEALERLEEALGITIDVSEMFKKAVIHCNGNSEVIYNYSGITSCKGAAQLLSGYKKCPYACLGFGDCLEVCPQNAIFIDPDKGIAVINQEECTGCGLCVHECPQNMIELVPADTKVVLLCNYQTLRDVAGREKCDTGCIHCRKCLRACEYDAINWNTERGIPEFDNDKCTLCRKCIEACEPTTLADFTVVRRAGEPYATVSSD
jgi:Na+-translocating ferredoxin:NAD+ oxidoreductase RNF subunit RnfB